VPLREEKQVKLRTVIIGGVIPLVVILTILWWRWDPLMDRICASREAAGEGPVAAGTADEAQAEVAGARADALAASQTSWTEWLGSPPAWPADFAEPVDCEAVEQELLRVCARLDAGSAGRGSAGADGACPLIRQVVEELMRRPPTATSELRSYEAMLSNVFHLFRVVGAERLDRLRSLAAAEEPHAEPAAMALYRWLVSREQCARSGSTTIRAEPLYDYAGFLFQTLGGQAYLRRRTPRVEALASFYALLILDRAVERDHNPHGIDPREEIRRTRELLAVQPLVFGDRYLELLDAMEARWKARE
jgi:hypothetical protein